VLGRCACECPLHEWHETLTLCRQPLERDRPAADHHGAFVKAWVSLCLECDRARARDEVMHLAARSLSRAPRPTILSFRLERLDSTAPESIPFRPRLRERLAVRVQFWFQDTSEHTLDVVAHAPNASRLELGRFHGRSHAAPGMVTMEGPLRGLDTAGWHRIHLVLDGEDVGHSSALFVLGPGKAPTAYVESDARLPTLTAAEATLRGVAVLIAGHDSESREALGAWLGQVGARVTLARDGADACARLSTSLRPDIIVTDVAMPHMDGYELVVRLRGELRLTDVPVVALTGDVRVARSAHPFDTVLMKPTSPRVVGETILEALRRRRRPA
jgi:CheY-like chemotaxis protein